MKIISRLQVKTASILTLTATLGMGLSMSQPVLAQEVIATTEISEINPQPGRFSYSAVDLQIMAQRPIDVNKFCKDYPSNSRCTQTTPPSITPTPTSVIEVEVKPTEEIAKTPENKGTGWAITPEVSTLGIGGSITRSLTPNFNARVGINNFGTSADITETDVTYEADLNLSNISTVIDYHPFKNSGFRMTGGLVFQDNNIKGTATPTNGSITIGDQTYTNGQLQSVDSQVSFANSVAPYLGLGWGNPVKPGKRWGFSLNLGVMFTGSPEIDVTPNYGLNTDQAVRDEIDASIDKEIRELEDDLDWLNIYPVISLGVSYQF
jgi:hypothetical protein